MFVMMAKDLPWLDMTDKYRLLRPVHGFIESIGRIVTIPPGEIVTLAVPRHNSFGLCSVVWNDQLVEAFVEDLQKNAAPTSQSPTE